ncbi:MAG TPA: patatin-like phospholipase family protein [Nevskiaceae bacterium]|nr:patatin-like phospholipase family protein [Nevskiaceae bacterium]
MDTTKTALVLSGGGSLGAVQAGMLEALTEAELPVDLVIGASVGALNAAFFAQNPTHQRALELAELWRGLKRKEVFPISLLTGIETFLLNRDYLVKPGALKQLIGHSVNYRRIEDAALPLHIVATDVLHGGEVLMSNGDLVSALLASTAIPLVFPQVARGGHLLVDGGVCDNTPIDAAVRLSATRVIVLPTGTPCAAQRPPRGLLALALHVLNLASMSQLDRDLARFATRAEIIVVPPLCPLDVSVFDFTKTAALIERSATQTRQWLAEGGLQRNGPLDVPLAHHDRTRRAA